MTDNVRKAIDFFQENETKILNIFSARGEIDLLDDYPLHIEALIESNLDKEVE